MQGNAMFEQSGNSGLPDRWRSVRRQPNAANQVDQSATRLCIDAPAIHDGVGGKIRRSKKITQCQSQKM
jgi:hypothetical protein